MKKLIIILALFITFSLRAETYGEFLKRFIPGNIITVPMGNGTRIKIGKINGENIENIKFYQYDKKNKLTKSIFAKKAKITDKGKGIAVFILSKAIVKHYNKERIDVTHVEKFELGITYQVMIKIEGIDYDITESIKKSTTK